MADESQRIRDILDRLHQELHGAADLDPQVADRVASLAREIRDALDQDPLDQDDHATADHPSVSERLGEVAVQFEESHPTLATTLARLIDVLTQLGI